MATRVVSQLPNKALYFASTAFKAPFYLKEQENKFHNFLEHLFYLDGWGGNKYQIMRHQSIHVNKDTTGILFHARVQDKPTVKKSLLNFLKILFWILMPIFSIIFLCLRNKNRWDNPSVLLDGMCNPTDFEKSLKKTEELDRILALIPCRKELPYNVTSPFIEKLYYVAMVYKALSKQQLIEYCQTYLAFAPELIAKIAKTKELTENQKSVLIDFLESEDSFYTIPKNDAEKWISYLRA